MSVSSTFAAVMSRFDTETVTAPAPVVVKSVSRMGATAALLAVQLWLGRWYVEAQAPRAGAEVEGWALIETLSALDGPVLAPHSPWYPVMAGKESSFHLIALWDIDNAKGPLGDRVAVIRASMAEQRWGAAMLNQKDLGSRTEDDYGMRETYRLVRELDERKIRPLTGYPVWPQRLYVPVADGQRPRRAPQTEK